MTVLKRLKCVTKLKFCKNIWFANRLDGNWLVMMDELFFSVLCYHMASIFPSSKTAFMVCKVDVLKGGDVFTNQIED